MTARLSLKYGKQPVFLKPFIHRPGGYGMPKVVPIVISKRGVCRSGMHDGTVREWIGKCLDVEDQRKAEKALQESEERFNKFMHHLPGLAWIKDLQGRYVYANETAGLVFQTPRERLIGKRDEDIFPEAVVAQFRENDRQALMRQTGVQVVETLKHLMGWSIILSSANFPFWGRTASRY